MDNYYRYMCNNDPAIYIDAINYTIHIYEYIYIGISMHGCFKNLNDIHLAFKGT